MSKNNSQEKPIAVSAVALMKWGCPSCGYRSGNTPISGGGTTVFQCGDCGAGCAVLADGLKRSTIGFGGYYPELQKHPREGIPSHGRADERPAEGGEFFSSRGIGTDDVKCFICGSQGPNSNISGYVKTKAAGERCVKMLSKGGPKPYQDMLDPKHPTLLEANEMLNKAMSLILDTYKVVGYTQHAVWADFTDNTTMLSATNLSGVVEALNTRHQMAFLDYREHSPDYVQVKIGACKEHLHQLKELDRLVADGVLTAEKIAAAKSHEAQKEIA